MKKILVFLLLITGLVKGQVVIPKSTTTFSNILATGNLTVNGTARVTGASTLTGIVTTSSLSSGSSLYLNASSGQDVFLQTSGSNRFRVNSSYGAIGVPYRVGSTTSPSATLDVTGTFSLSNQSFSVGTTNLTGGNSGTIAVLSDAVFPVMFNAQSTSLTDGNTYYCNTINRGLSTSASTGLLYLPYNVTLVGYSMNFFTTGTLGSAENMTVSISGTPDVVLLSNVTVTTVITTYTASGLNQDFNAGTGIETKISCPTWATNPTNVHVATTYWFVRRQ
jgi:hypothetical protein